MKPVLLFDLDNTLFNTRTCFGELVTPLLAEALRVENEDIHQVTDEYKASLARNTDFDPQQYLDWLHEEFGGDRAQLEQLYFKPELFQKSIFSDVLSTLDQLKETQTLGIYSEGVAAFQHQKLKLTGLEPWFDPEYTFILHRKLEPEVLATLPPAVIVDDREDVVNELLTMSHLKPIWINRTDSVSHQEAPTIHSLSELLSHL